MTYTLSRHMQLSTALEQDNLFTPRQADELARIIDAHLPSQSLSEEGLERVLARHTERLKDEIRTTKEERFFIYQKAEKVMEKTTITLNKIATREHPVFMALAGCILGFALGALTAAHKLEPVETDGIDPMVGAQIATPTSVEQSQ